MRAYTSGFTLIELLIVVVIIAVLAGISYPMYTNYVFRVNRADGQKLLLQIAAEQERHFTSFNRYALDLTAAPPTGLGMTQILSEYGFYSAAVAAGPTGNDQSFLLTATPQGRQSSDYCGNFTLNSSGTRAYSGNETNGRCW